MRFGPQRNVGRPRVDDNDVGAGGYQRRGGDGAQKVDAFLQLHPRPAGGDEQHPYRDMRGRELVSGMKHDAVDEIAIVIRTRQVGMDTGVLTRPGDRQRDSVDRELVTGRRH